LLTEFNSGDTIGAELGPDVLLNRCGRIEVLTNLLVLGEAVLKVFMWGFLSLRIIMVMFSSIYQCHNNIIWLKADLSTKEYKF
jgi:hypothetical protein